MNLSKEDAQAAQPLTLSQALTITAGLAGLIGLLSGVVIRFSLANSSNARFLSPLQTFPALSDWAPELPQETADSHYLPAGTERDTWEGSSEFDSLGRTDADSFQGGDFDAFADRTESSGDRDSGDPWEVLRNGPSLSERDAENDFSEGESRYTDDLEGEDSPYSEDAFEDPYLEAPYTQDPYAEDSYVEDPYAEEPYEDTYEEPASDNYFDEWSSEPFIDDASGDRYEE